MRYICSGKIFVPNYGKHADIKVNGTKIRGSDFTSDFIFIGDYASRTYQVEALSPAPCAVNTLSLFPARI